MSRESAFAGQGLKASVNDVVNEMKALYLADTIPWVVGYSGGKDSTAVLQLVWRAVSEVEPSQRHKPVHVISTDTLAPLASVDCTKSVWSVPTEPARLP